MLEVPLALLTAVSGGLGLMAVQQRRTLAQNEARARAMQADLEARLEESRKAVSEAHRATEEAVAVRGELLANVSHELRTPLTSICGYVELLEQRTTDPKTLELLGRVSRNAQDLVTLINKMLDLSRLKAGRVEMTIAPVPLEECLEAAYHAIEPQLLAKSLTFELHLPPQPILVLGSFERLQQVFCNLLGNAVKFTQQGTVGVEVSTSDTMAELRFHDTGVGIAAEQVAHIFDEFTQADKNVRRQFGGTGLGLAICRKLMELHRGTLRAESVLGQGSTFVVTVPLYRRNA